nr:hypothetical protein Ade03nite_77710 [Actinoplanes derwentensis]
MTEARQRTLATISTAATAPTGSSRGTVAAGVSGGAVLVLMEFVAASRGRPVMGGSPAMVTNHSVWATRR